MSGGFFRGTSADQDTRFSNKQAKLMKSQKFPAELDHLVDMTKVKADVIKPWIAHRVTELLGFEDEVLINFIYGLLDGKEVNGKLVQISLTGFMEKNTGKFMKELWTLLLSAQQNASGVPQQFLDAKEEETRIKKAELDRIANEIQKKKDMEAKELEEEKLKKMDGGTNKPKAAVAALDPNRRRASSSDPEDEKERDRRNGSRGIKRISRSPLSADRHPSSPRGSRSRSISKSFSNSRSHSEERNKSRSVSKSPQQRGRSISSEKPHRSTRKRSVTPRRRRSPRGSVSPPRRTYYRRRSRSRSYRKSISPVRRRFRSPLRRRSPSPVRRRSPSPVRRRSPSPVRRRFRSPVRRRSPSPSSYSPVRRRSPSPVKRRSPFPVQRRHRRSPSTPRRRSPSPMRRRSPIYGRRRSPIRSRRRSPSPYRRRSPSPTWRGSPPPARRKFPENQRRSPVRSPRRRADDPVEKREGPSSVVHRPPSSMRSPQRDPNNHNDSRKRPPSWSPSPEKSPILSESPPGTRKRNSSEDRRSLSPYESPVRQTRKHMARDESRSPPQRLIEHKSRHESPEMKGREEGMNNSRDDGDHKLKSSQKRSTHSSNEGKQKDSPVIARHKEEYSPERSGGRQATESRTDNIDLRKRNQEMKSEKTSGRIVHPEVLDKQKSPITNKHFISSEKPLVSYSGEGKKSDERKRSHSSNTKDTGWNVKSETVVNNQIGSLDSSSEDSDKGRADVKEKRKHKKSDRHEKASDDDYSSDSQIEGRKEAKRRKKEEKRMRKEEKRRRHEEKRRRKKEERRAEKLKTRSKDNLSPPADIEKNKKDAYASDEEDVARGKSRSSDAEEAESEQKKLEVELRKKALESLRAKKGISH